MWTIIVVNYCCLGCQVPLMNYMLIIIECEISPLLFECFPYGGNVQITRISCWCELSLLRVVLGSLWYVTKWGFCFCFPLLRTALWTMSLNTFGIRFSLSCLCWGRGAKDYWTSCWFWIICIIYIVGKTGCYRFISFLFRDSKSTGDSIWTSKAYKGMAIVLGLIT